MTKVKTQDEIVEKLNTRGSESLLFDFFPEVVINYLDFEHAKPFLNQNKLQEQGEDKIRDTWKSHPLTKEAILEEMKDYMEFAWGKVIDHRGLSAERSIQKMQAWCWLLSRDEEIDWDNYPQYGAPILRQICEVFGLPKSNSSYALNMAKGRPCEPECDMGCGE